MNTKYLKKLSYDERKALLEEIGYDYLFSGFRKGHSLDLDETSLKAKSYDYDFRNLDEYFNSSIELNDFIVIKNTLYAELSEEIPEESQTALRDFMTKKFGKDYKQDCSEYFKQQEEINKDSDKTNKQEEDTLIL